MKEQRTRVVRSQETQLHCSGHGTAALQFCVCLNTGQSAPPFAFNNNNDDKHWIKCFYLNENKSTLDTTMTRERVWVPGCDDIAHDCVHADHELQFETWQSIGSLPGGGGAGVLKIIKFVYGGGGGGGGVVCDELYNWDHTAKKRTGAGVGGRVA